MLKYQVLEGCITLDTLFDVIHCETVMLNDVGMRSPLSSLQSFCFHLMLFLSVDIRYLKILFKLVKNKLYGNLFGIHYSAFCKQRYSCMLYLMQLSIHQIRWTCIVHRLVLYSKLMFLIVINPSLSTMQPSSSITIHLILRVIMFVLKLYINRKHSSKQNSWSDVPVQGTSWSCNAG